LGGEASRERAARMNKRDEQESESRDDFHLRDAYFNPDDPDDLKWEQDWLRLHRLALKDFKAGVPPLATYSSEKGTVVVIRASVTGIDGDPNPVGIYLSGEERNPQGGFMDFHGPDLTALGFTKEQYKELPLTERARLNAQIQVEIYGCG
jgi:hypothetical protein